VVLGRRADRRDARWSFPRRRPLPRSQKEGEPVVYIHPGDIVYFAPGEKHWHGAAPDSFMVHIAVNPAINSDGGTNWMAPVSDEEYADS
jgi:hypothetical protein